VLYPVQVLLAVLEGDLFDGIAKSLSLDGGKLKLRGRWLPRSITCLRGHQIDLLCEEYGLTYSKGPCTPRRATPSFSKVGKDGEGSFITQRDKDEALVSES
jgi:hypothetical protein